MLAKLAPYHRAKLASLLAATSEFTSADVAIALELIDCALSDPSSDDYRFVLWEEGDRVLGYACFGSAPMTQGSYDLYWLVVDQEARRTGIGRELLASVEGSLRRSGARLIRVETAGLDSYAAARAFYERSGYEEAARIRDFYWPGNDLYVYIKYLRQ
ncbi:MAG TPA: GNAT family N-acetyltransferase [Polyangiaceae bacterium]